MDFLKHDLLGTIYGDFSSPEVFKDKLAKAKLVRDYANANICVNV